MKRIVICCDGTWNRPDQVDRGTPCPTNVSKMAFSVAGAGSNGAPQQVYYQTGVGTRPGERLVGLVGAGLSRNILNAYRYLAAHYEPGDDLFLFGFSRGAYTVRSLAGLVRTCGILRREHMGELPSANTLYRRRDDAAHPREREATLFRKTFSYEGWGDTTRIKFLGVWDTVGTLGIPLGWLGPISRRILRLEFHDRELSRCVENAFHALAIDERRGPFAPAIWEQPKGKNKGNQHIEQAWFAGVHGNVGGGYADARPSDIAFTWIQQHAARRGLSFDQPYLDQGVDGVGLGALRESRTGLYRLLPSPVRKVCVPRNGLTYESIHPSVNERMRIFSSYRPKNVPADLLS